MKRQTFTIARNSNKQQNIVAQTNRNEINTRADSGDSSSCSKTVEGFLSMILVLIVLLECESDLVSLVSFHEHDSSLRAFFVH
jgi:hypothetical protein